MTYENAGNPGNESNGKPNFGGCSTTPEWNISAKDTIFKMVVLEFCGYQTYSVNCSNFYFTGNQQEHLIRHCKNLSSHFVLL